MCLEQCTTVDTACGPDRLRGEDAFGACLAALVTQKRGQVPFPLGLCVVGWSAPVQERCATALAVTSKQQEPCDALVQVQGGANGARGRCLAALAAASDAGT
jgi:hypothetical protein